MKGHPPLKPGHYNAEPGIPCRRIFYSREEKRRWNRIWKAWKDGGRTDPSVWQEFTDVLEIPGFRFDHWHGGRFAESMVALELVQNGYRCFHACQLFRYGKTQGTWLEGTQDIEKLLEEDGLPKPRDLGSRLQPPPKNPDIAAYLNKRWRFCEVKFNTDVPSQGQLVALAVLRELLDATVEVVQVVEEHDRRLKVPAPYDCDYTITS